MFTSDVVMGFVRHLLTLGAGYLITKGYFDDATSTQLIGAVMTLLGFGWSFWAKQGGAAASD
jgi:hypothetical protein